MIRVLQSKDEIAAARAELRRRGLDFTDRSLSRLWRALYRVRFRAPMPDADALKSWDVRTALETIERYLPDRRAAVLDMGCYNSEILWALHKGGYRDLAGCDLNPLCTWMPFWHRIRYRTADLTRTPFSEGRFAALTCMSVVEHGVPLDGLVAEARRLLRPGGLFLFTTDFDGSGARHDIDPKFRVFEQAWQIFSRDTLGALCDRFLDAGFEWLEPGPRAMEHVERPVHWNDQEYTFVFVGLRKAGDGPARP